MQFTLAAAAQPEAAQLFVCTEAGQLNDETAQLLCHSLEEKDSFAETKLPVSGSLKSIAVLRFADLATETLQKAAKEAAAWAQKQAAVAVDLSPFCAENAPRVVAALVAAKPCTALPASKKKPTPPSSRKCNLSTRSTAAKFRLP